jgi:lipopolysaccharide/colanic/teichoic acid biosynthesis glycosyltransferase
VTAVDAGYRAWGKRALDLALLAGAAPLAAPAVAVGWSLARAGSPGPGFFRQERIGRRGRPFTIWKLRTMTVPRDGARDTLGVTAAGDARVTATGRRLRGGKLDELPQLWNVLRGDMSLVGPRPDIAEWVRRLPDGFGPALTVRPGLTGLAAVVYADEESVLAAYPSAEEAYATVVLPRKLELDRLYAENVSLGLDLRILALTALLFLRRPAATRRAERLAAHLGEAARVR